MTTTWRARYVLPIDGPPIEGGAVSFEKDRIVSIERSALGDDLGDAVIMPGLVNAHTHLEFSDLRQPLGHAGMPLPDWIRRVVQHRINPDRPATAGRQAIDSGLNESLDLGTTCLGEIATTRDGLAPFDRYPGLATIFLEALGLSDERIRASTEQIEAHLQTPGGWAPAISPHAPYSVHPNLLGHLIAQSQGAAAPVAMHLAESREEIELLDSGSGPFRELLIELGAWRPGVFPTSGGLDQILFQLAAAPRALVIHGNYLTDDQVGFLARHADHMSVVWCPRTWHFFRHSDHPVERLLAAGVNVALGTDSRASNPDLSVLSEMQSVARWVDAIDARDIVHMGTVSGARALGRDAGSLRVGGRADLVVIRAPLNTGNPYEAVLHPDATVERVVRGGELRTSD